MVDMKEWDAATLRLARDPGAWQCWPRLPLKQYKPGQDTVYGFLIDGSGFKVHEGIVFLPLDPEARTWEYDSPEAMLDDGWKVD